MESPPLNPHSHRLSPPTSGHLTPPPRNSMEDEDASVKRKRPRLDSGQRAYHNMGAENMSPTERDSELSTAHDQTVVVSSNSNSPNRTPSPAPASSSETGPSAQPAPDRIAGTPSKVTINLRDPSSNPSPSKQPNLAAADAQPDTKIASATGTGAVAEFVPSPVTLVDDESSPGSVQIEVADPEDMDGPPQESSWHKAGTSDLETTENRPQILDWAVWNHDMLDRFPIIGGLGLPWNEGFMKYWEVLTSNADDMLRLIDDTEQWLSTYLSTSESAPEQWFGLFSSEHIFWKHFSKVFRSLHREEFMQVLGEACATNSPQTNPIGKILCRLLTLTTRFLQVDALTLRATKEKKDAELVIFSLEYLNSICFTLGHKKIQNTLDSYNADTYSQESTSVNLCQQLCSNSSDSFFRSAADCWTAALDHNKVDCVQWNLMAAIIKTVSDLDDFWLDNTVGNEQNSLQLAIAFFEFFQVVTEKIQAAVKKQLAVVNGEILLKIVNSTASVVQKMVYTDIGLLARVADESVCEVASGLTPHHQLTFTAAAWRLNFLERCIREGRMEIRIVSLEALSKILIDIYREFIQQGNGSDHPIVLWTSARLRSSRIIDYLLSADSHPQLVTRSHNVIGFLAASHSYTNEQTDMIWDCVQKSEDPRMFEAMVGALTTTLGLLDIDSLLYFCAKFQELPASCFDHRWRNLLFPVISQLQKYWEAEQTIDVLPYQVLIRLLREIGTCADISSEQRVEVWNIIGEAMKRLIFRKWSFEQRAQIYQECLEDFALKNGNSTGTCLVFNRLLECYGKPDVIALSQMTDVAGVIVDEFCHLNHIESLTGVNLQNFTEPVKERLHILEKLLFWTPELVPLESGRDLWASMVGDKAVGPQARSDAWESLATVASSATDVNPVLEAGAKDFIPHLKPEYHCRSLLLFAHRFWEYQGRVETAAGSEDEEKRDDREQIFWQLALLSNDDYLSAGASRFLVERMVQEARALPKDELTPAQQDFVSRTMTQFIESANDAHDLRLQLSKLPERDPKVLERISLLNLHTSRAFTMLRQLAQGLRSLEPQPLSERSESQTSRRSINGEKVEIKYQAHDRGVASPIKSLEIGNLSTIAELADWIRAKTGFSRFNLISGGQRIDQEAWAGRTIQETRVGSMGQIIVHKIPGSESLKVQSAPLPRLMPFEKEIMKHFQSLYDLLSTDPNLSQAVLEFLVTFPPHQDIVDLVTKSSQPLESLLPLAEPCKLVYSIHAMRYSLRVSLDEGAIDEAFMIQSVQSITKALCQVPFSSGALSPSQHYMVFNMVTVLNQLLKEPVLPSIRNQYFDSPELLVDKLMDLCHLPDEQPIYNLSQAGFAVLLEAARLNSAVWSRFTSHTAIPSLFESLLLSNPRLEYRTMAQKTIQSILATLTDVENQTYQEVKEEGSAQISAFAFEEASFLEFLWNTVLSILPKTASKASSSAQFFQLAIEVFRRLTAIDANASLLQTDLEAWFVLLLSHKHGEVLGRDNADQFVKGMINLINLCLSVLARLGQTPLVDESVLDRLFSSFIFPPLTAADEQASSHAVAPILDSDTRASFYTAVMSLCLTTQRLTSSIETINEALMEVSDSNIAWNYERQKNIRASAGYPGLINLSNTCYLNSLMTQLFMNPRFREFILSLELQDPDRQRLLFAIRALFTDLQDGWSKAVLTQELADSIETYEGPLDPAIQMDADEAFNLIFDRIEGQLSSAADKGRFKSLFGGQIVQQIKSRECDHISERLEPVTAIQCEIQGKVHLEDSLKSYIEGETMEGDNKYKCSTCDRYVNAVKRACLRDVPNNLIFHLKRFDFDLVQGTRNKLNDFFSFPERINMTPYTDKYLQTPEAPSEPDNFVLMGVLVHSGTAELGHYYSFIRERPFSMGSWVEFNDADVSRYDIRSMRDHCFGGDTRDQFNASVYQKMYNAYMLFYQRESSIVPEDKHYQVSQPLGPTRTEVPQELASNLAFRNGLLARTYCFFDPYHARFLRSINVKRRDLLGRGVCSPDHRLEVAYITYIWQHVLHIFGRDHQRQGCSDALDIVVEMMANCNDCCRISMDWLLGGDDMRLRLLLLRLPEVPIRTRIGIILRDGLRKLKEEDPAAYGSTDIDLDMDEDFEPGATAPSRFRIAMSRLRQLQVVLASHVRAWVDFYDLLSSFSSFGREERAYMVHAGFLRHAMEVLLIENDHDWESLFRARHLHYIKALEKRQFNLSGLVRFLGAILPFTSFPTDPALEDESGTLLFKPLLERTDVEILSWKLRPAEGDHEVPWFLDRFAASDDATVSHHRPLRDVVKFLVQADDVLDLNRHFEDLINVGLEKNPASLAEPYLHIALAYIEVSHDALLIEKIVYNIAQSVRTIGTYGGLEHLDFFRRACQVNNPVAFPERSNQVKLFVTRLSQFWAIPLMTYPKDNVGEQSRKLVEDLVFPELSCEDEEMIDTKNEAFDVIFNRLVRDIHRILQSGQPLQEQWVELVKFCDDALPFAYRTAEEEDKTQKQEQVKGLIQRIQNFIVVNEDGSNGNVDSDDLTDVSSTYEEPGV